MQLIRDKTYRLQHWSEEANGYRWTVEVFYPATTTAPLVLLSATYSADYDTLVKVTDALEFGVRDEIPDLVECAVGKTELKYYSPTGPSKQGQYAYTASGELDMRTQITKVLGLEGATPELIRMERGV